ncbi:MAG: CDP-alcohol phosphatidyltransferase family protein [Saprospiraceae bacterium]|nr:CDP-alcohol phosphatidyltransferase family protein [Saprospiraceae bacterium]
MISVYQIKPKFQQLLLPALKTLHRWGVSANAITLSAILLSAGTGLVFWFTESPLALLWVALALLLRMALNALDGMMARNYQMQSRLGEVLNEMGDIVSDIFLFFPLLKLSYIQPNILFGFILLSVINEFAGVLSKAMGGERRYDGPMGKSDRALFLGLLCLLLYFWPAVQAYASTAFLLAIGLLLLSTYTRLKKSI